MGKIVNITSAAAGLNLGTLTLGNISAGSNGAIGPGMSPWAVKGLLADDIFNNSSRIKKYEVIETPEDLLAMSVAWHRIRKENKEAGTKTHPPTITTLLSNDLINYITPDDRVKADTIRIYYSKKIMMLTLMEIRLTSFREDLKDYLHGDCKKFIEKVVPMIYRLPEFYEFDIQFENIKKQMAPAMDRDVHEFLRSTSKSKSLELTPIISLKRENRKLKIFEYWMKSLLGNAYCISISHDNPLKPLWDREFTREKITFNTDLNPRVRDGLFYYQLKNYQVT